MGLSGGSLSMSAGTTVALPTLTLAGTSLSVAAGSSVSLPSTTTLVTTTLTLESPSTSFGSLSLAGSTLTGTGALTVTGALDVSGTGNSNVNGSGAFITQGSTVVNMGTAGATLNVAGSRPWTNQGTLTVTGDDTITLGTAGIGGTLTNAAGGTLVLAGTAANPITQSTASTLVNAGTLLKSSTGTQTLDASSLQNTGTLTLSQGQLNLSGSLAQSGTIGLGGGTVLQTSSSLVNAGVIGGTGTLRLGAAGSGTLSNAGGTLRPGASPGTTNIVGNLDLTGGTLEIELGGTAVGVDSDLINVSGNVVLGGTLNAVLFGGFAPADADAIPFIRHGGTSTGLFSPITLPSGFAVGYRLAAGESARAIFSAFGTTKIFINAGGDLNWNTPSNWDAGSLPGVLDTALISAGFAVVHGAGSNTITGLTINAANSLDVTGGTLIVSGDTALGGTLRVSGTGSVTLGGVVNSGGTVNLGGGDLRLDGAAEFARMTRPARPEPASTSTLSRPRPMRARGRSRRRYSASRAIYQPGGVRIIGAPLAATAVGSSV
jgi:hypothetical protein